MDMKTKLNKVVKGFKLLKALNNSSAENSQEKEQELIQVLGELGVFFEKKPTANGLDLEPLDESQLKPLDIPENASKQEVRKALEAYLKQFQGKTIQTVDGKMVSINKRGRNHLIHDSVYENRFIPQAMEHVLEVLKTGKFVGRENVYKTRQDDFIAFHKYEKLVDVDGTDGVYLQIKVGELRDGKYQIYSDGLIIYTGRALNEQQVAIERTNSDLQGSSIRDGRTDGDYPDSSTDIPTSLIDGNNITAMFDDMSSVAGNGLLVYSVKDKKKEAEKSAPFTSDSTLNTAGTPSTNLPDISSMTRTSAVPCTDDSTAIFDDVSSDEYIFIEILAVREKNPQASDKDLSDEDKQFLKDVADGKIDVTAKDVEIRIKSLCDKIIDEFSENQTLRELLREALEACRQKALSLTDTFLTQQNIH